MTSITLDLLLAAPTAGQPQRQRQGNSRGRADEAQQWAADSRRAESRVEVACMMPANGAKMGDRLRPIKAVNNSPQLSQVRGDHRNSWLLYTRRGNSQGDLLVD